MPSGGTFPSPCSRDCFWCLADAPAPLPEEFLTAPLVNTNESAVYETIQMLDHSVLLHDECVPCRLCSLWFFAPLFMRWLPRRGCSLVDAKTSRAHVRTRLYFTSESHIQSIMNAFRQWSLTEVRVVAPRRHSVPCEPMLDACFVRVFLPLFPRMERSC